MRVAAGTNGGYQPYNSDAPAALTSSVATSTCPSDAVRRRYHTRIAHKENRNMMVEIALISGVIPRRKRPQISSGRVLSRPIRKKLTAISSMENVKIKSAAPMIDNLRLGMVMRQKVCQ